MLKIYRRLPDNGCLINRVLEKGLKEDLVTSNIPKEFGDKLLENSKNIFYITSTNLSFPESMQIKKLEYIGNIRVDKDGNPVLDSSGNPIPEGFGISFWHGFLRLSEFYCGLFDNGIPIGPKDTIGGYSNQNVMFCGLFRIVFRDSEFQYIPQNGEMKTRSPDGIFSYTGIFDEEGGNLTGGTVYNRECHNYECGNVCSCLQIVEVITGPIPVSKYFPTGYDEEEEEEEE